MYEHLRGMREDRDLSQKDMAELLNVHQTTYSGYERGDLNIPIQTLKWLADYFETSIDYLLDVTDERTPHPRRKKR